MKEILRKCHECDKSKVKTININKDKFIYYNGSYYHYNCFIKCKTKEKDNNLSQEELVKLADKMVLNTKELKTVRDSIDRDRLTYWIYENYNISVLPTLFFQKIKQINDGTFSKRINTSISYYDLLQIFIKMKSYLDKVNNKNERNGKKIPIPNRIDYDLAIVINNYDEYLKWKQKQKSENTEKKQIKEEIAIKNNIKINTITSMQRNENDDEINIADILDEVF